MKISWLMTATTSLLLLAHYTVAAASAAIYPPSSSSASSSASRQRTSSTNNVARSSRWKLNNNNANYRHDATPSNRSDGGDSSMHHRHPRRQLSISDQLDILRLGFIPTASSSSTSSKNEEQMEDDELKPSRRNMNRIPRGGGGGGVFDYDATSTPSQSTHQMRQQQQHRHIIRQLSTTEQLDILRLGFIPTSSSSLPLSSSGITRFHRGGGHDVADTSTTKLTHHPLSQRCATILSHPLSLASIFAFLAGYSNVLCYSKFQCYATMMTGNIVTMSIYLGEQQWKDALWRCTFVVCFLVGSVISRVIELGGQRCSSSSSSSRSGMTVSQQKQNHCKVIAPIVIVIFAIAEKLLSSTSSSSSEGKYKIVIPILALGYGMVYATANRALNATMTQLLTGHVTKLGSSFSDYLIGGGSKPWSGKKEVIMSSCILASFVSGGVVGSRLLALVATGFPLFALLGLVYALVLVLF